jgi:hypothetical protein
VVPPDEQTLGDDRDALLVLAAFRQRRCDVALRKLLPPYLPASANPDTSAWERIEALLARHTPTLVRRVEGGEYWMARGARDRIYEIGLKGLADGHDASGEVIRRLALLIRIHRDISCYYVEDLYAASQDPCALFEHVYHQVAALRFLAKLQKRVDGPELGEIPRPAWSAACELLGFSPEQDRKALRSWLIDQRMDRVLALRRMFEREREVFRSRVSADSLIDWIDAICGSDIALFQRAGEAEIARQCGLLARLLEDMKGDALREKMDYPACIEHRLRQIGDLFPSYRPFRDTAALWAGHEALCQGLREKPRPCADERNDHFFRLVDYVSDLWLCHRKIGQDEPRRQAREVAECLYRTIIHEASYEARALFEVLCARQFADDLLMAASPWDWALRLPGSEADQRKKYQTSKDAEEAIRRCNDGLSALERSSDALYPRYKSYFHSLKGRAYYLLGRFTNALRELDLARSGLTLAAPADRESLAVTLLRLSECLMSRADCILAEAPDEKVTLASRRALRRLARAEHTLDQAENALVGARQNLHWWACLYQLRAQLQVERLLVHTLFPPGSAGALGADRFNVRLVHALNRGLRAIRQGLDVVLPEKGRDSLHEEHFYRLWVELTACGAYLRSMTLASETWNASTETDLWQRWMRMNTAIGLEELTTDRVKSAGQKAWTWDGQAASGLAARRIVQGRICDLVAGGMIEALKSAFRGEAGGT